MKISNFDQILLPKEDYLENQKKECVTFLKKKRQEKGLTLEDLSTGVASISYLSRMENHLIEPDDTILKILFERMHLDYSLVQEERNQNIFDELLRKSLVNDSEGCDELVRHAMKEECYLESEYELMNLFHGIMDKRFDVVDSLILKLSEKAKFLNNQELYFYLYCSSRYAYDTCEFFTAYKDIKTLCAIEIDDDILRYSIYDLAISICYRLGKWEMVQKYYSLLSASHETYFHRSLFLHEFKLLELEAKTNLDAAKKKLHQIKDSLDETDDEIMESYFYTKIKMLYHSDNINDILLLFTKIKESPRILAYFGLAAFKSENLNLQHRIMVEIRRYDFGQYHLPEETFCHYLVMKDQGMLAGDLYKYLKNNIILSMKLNYDYELYFEAVKEYLEMGVLCGKHRETIKLLRDVLNNSSGLLYV